MVSCADGRVCPEGAVCTVDGCALPNRCGDGQVDEGEECDDGNRVAHDGCSLFCTAYICGNGALEDLEECDDGNLRSHDGCSSGCLVERPNWHQLEASAAPALRAFTAGVWIPAQGRALIAGGYDGTADLDSAWWWSGEWSPAPSLPAAIRGHAMAWDGERVVMFGGLVGGAPTDQCLMFSDQWTTCASSPITPPARSRAAMTVGRDAGTVLLYGGDEGDRRTWLRGASGWTSSGEGPPPIGVALAFERTSDTHVMISWQGEWLDTGSGWQLAGSEPALADGALIYDDDRARTTFVGGLDIFVGRSSGALERTGVGWLEVPVGARPRPRASFAAFHDPIRRGIVIIGGETSGGTVNGVAMDVWILRWESTTPDESCVVGEDLDADGASGCDDADCWGRCDPTCPPSSTACPAARSRCGDGTCNPYLEDIAVCPGDCS